MPIEVTPIDFTENLQSPEDCAFALELALEGDDHQHLVGRVRDVIVALRRLPLGT